MDWVPMYQSSALNKLGFGLCIREADGYCSYVDTWGFVIRMP